ncbi:hypothetical protein BZA70DRAFT_26920 [Myxozyma melibiosi]|uniref:Uncharacterized protein n=1 Tax=Myxozyma melibiosi TaxID=54550 RepID=A0ABR1FDI4_9ASCO
MILRTLRHHWWNTKLRRHHYIILLVVFIFCSTVVVLFRLDSSLDFSVLKDDPDLLTHLTNFRPSSENLTVNEFEWIEPEDHEDIVQLKADPTLLDSLVSEVDVAHAATHSVPSILLISHHPSTAAADAEPTPVFESESALAVDPQPTQVDPDYGDDLEDDAYYGMPSTLVTQLRAPSATAAAAEESPIAESKEEETFEREPPKYGKLVDTPKGPRVVHMLTPSTTINQLVCKSLFSSALNNYPHPILINFEHKVRDEFEAHFLKLTSIHEYLDSDDVEEDDLVLIFDAFDVWYQLDFQILINRYYEMQAKEEANKGADYAESAVFGADKGCWPNAPTSDACTKVPQSTLADDVYGPGTDKSAMGFRNRPRWLNSGTIMGPVPVVREVFNRAVKATHNAFNSDQFVLAEIWAQFDLPIILDYESYLFQTLTHSHSDVVFLYQEQIEPGQVISGPVVDPLTKDKSTDGGRTNSNPIDSFNVLDNTPLALTPFLNGTRRQRMWRLSNHHTAWNRVSGNVPAILHLNGDKSCLNTWWHKMWWVHDVTQYHQWYRLKYVRHEGGAFLDKVDGTMEYRDFDQMCGSYPMFDIVKSRLDGQKIRKGSRPSIDPEPFMVGMNPHTTPADVWEDLMKLRDKKLHGSKSAARKKHPTL